MILLGTNNQNNSDNDDDGDALEESAYSPTTRYLLT